MPAEIHSTPMTRHRRVAFAFVVVVVFFGTLEVLLRVLVGKDELLFAWERPDGLETFEASGALVGPRNLRLSTQDGPYRVEYRTNEAGLRESQETPRSKPSGTSRYLAVGDSWIWGTSVTQGATLPDRIEARLSSLRGTPVLVENAGIQGMSGFDMYVAFRRYAAAYEFDGVIIGKPHNETREEQVAERRKAFVASATPMPTNDWRLYLLVRRFVFRSRMPAVPLGVDERLGNESVVQGAITDVIRLVREARSAGLSVVFLDFPNSWRVQRLSAPEYSSSPAWVQALDAEAVPHAGHAMLERSCWGYEDIDHPSEAGADAIAVVAAQLMESGQTVARRVNEPSCSESEGAGPGKPDTHR